jgi:hypothetical protein
MARIATKDTIAFEHVGVVPGDDTVVRREVKAGGYVPDNWDLEDEGAAEESDSFSCTGLGAAPHGYPHQIDPETGKLKDEHVEDVDDATRPSSRAGKGGSGARGRKAEEKAETPAHRSGQKAS